ncbi:MAG: ABC-2 transporter permease, partial [Lacisediminihabitans sp.]
MIAAFTRFDCVNLATTQARRVLIPLMFVIVMGIALPFSTAPVLIGALVVVASLSYPFQADERGLLDTLYATTSVTRRDVVIGRYLTVLLYAIFATGIGVIVSLVDDTVRHQQFEWPAMASALLAAFALVVVGVSVQLPV